MSAQKSVHPEQPGDYDSVLVRLHRTVDTYRPVLEKNLPDHLFALHTLASTYYDFGNYETAIGYYRKICELSEIRNAPARILESNIKALIGIGNAYLEMKRPVSASEYYMRAKQSRIFPYYAKIINRQLARTDSLKQTSLSTATDRKENRSQNIPAGYPQKTHKSIAEIMRRCGNILLAENEFERAARTYSDLVSFTAKWDSPSAQADALASLGAVRMNMSCFKEAVDAFVQEVDIRERILDYYLPKTIRKTTQAYNNLGMACIKLRNPDEAIRYLKKGSAIWREYWKKYVGTGKEYGAPASLYQNTWNTYDLLFLACLIKADWTGAIHYSREVATLYAAPYAGRFQCKIGLPKEYLQACLRIGELNYRLGNYTAAEKYFFESLDNISEHYGTTSPYYAETMNRIGCTFFYRRDYSQADYFLGEAYKIWNRIDDDRMLNTSRVLRNAGAVWQAWGKKRKAKQIIALADSLSRNSIPDIDAKNRKADNAEFSWPEYFRHADMYYLATQQYELAIQWEENALRLYEADSDFEDRKYIETLQRLGSSYRQNHDALKAAESYQSALAYLEQHGLNLSEDSLYTATLTDMVSVSNQLGDYLKSVEYADKALNLWQTATRSNAAAYAECLRESGVSSLHLGDYATAEYRLMQSLQVEKDLLGGNRIEYALSLNWLAYVYYLSGEFLTASKYYDSALKTFSSLSRFTDFHLEKFYTCCGDIYFVLGKYALAIDEYQKALALKKKQVGARHPAIVPYLLNLALLSDLETAEKHLLNALNILQENKMQESPLYLRTRFNLGYTYLRSGNNESACRNFQLALTLCRQLIRTNFAFMTEKERFDYWNNNIFQPLLNYIFLAANTKTGKEKGSLVYDACLTGKSHLLSASTEFNKLIAESNDSAIRETAARLYTVRRKIDLLTQNPQPQNADHINIESLKAYAYGLEKSLITHIRELGDYTKYLSLTWEDIAQALRDREIAIEFAYCPIDSAYTAIILRKDWESPKIVPLFSDRENQLGKAIENASTDIYLDESLYELVWKKIVSDLHPGDNIYFSPAGALHQIGIEYLLTDKKLRMCDKYNMFRLSSTRELIDRKEKGIRNKTAVLYGGLNYNSSVEDMLTVADNFPQSERALSRKGKSEPMHTLTWRYLNGTKAEVAAIAPILTARKFRWKSYTGNEGIEESFKALSGQKNGILHIATHGFYLPENQSFKNKKANLEDRSLTASGLIFAGANNAWLSPLSVPEGLEDGILTALEVSRLDLRGTELVVLSACQTGLGAIAQEGVFGLQRAFKKAGAQTILMSLWNISDEATQAMMTEFYRSLTGGMTKREAFLHAQQQIKKKNFMLNGTLRSGNDPYFWASFIMLD